MKTIKQQLITLTILLFCVILSSCSNEKGETTQRLNGNETNLPPELKGLKVYWVSTGMSGVYVATLNNQVNSLTYSSGESSTSTILINKQGDSIINLKNRLIEIKQILLENDSIIVCRK